MSDRTVDVPWTLGDEAYVVTVQDDCIVSVRLAVATRQTESAKREFLAGFGGEQEDAFYAAVDAALAQENA